MTGPGQPRTCSHPINSRTLTGVCQAVRMFSPCQFQVYISYLTIPRPKVHGHVTMKMG